MVARGPVAVDFQQRSFEGLGNLGDKKDWESLRCRGENEDDEDKGGGVEGVGWKEGEGV